VVSDDDLLDLYEDAPCGYLSLTPDARIVRLNRTLAEWVGAGASTLIGQSIHALLSFGGRIAYETHLSPLLRLKGVVDEIALDLMHADGAKVPVIANAREKRTDGGDHCFTRITLFRSVERRRFERDLVRARNEADARADAEHEESLLREQFIAVLGHDLRNPLAAMGAGVQMLGDREALSDRGRFMLNEMRASVNRATTLIDDVLDLARGRLGSGFNISRKPEGALAIVLEHVIGEIRAVQPEREIISEFCISEPVCCDSARIAQLASNLIANAATHGVPGQPVLVDASIEAGSFVFSVANVGEPISPSVRAQLFQPFFRGAARQSHQGLGLGLFIVNEIAKAHEGTMEVTSTEQETRFTFTMPVT
jgi:sigma-B regulation protein RsbU (phosphoserine phosphatase)